jgi:hypothetical protein
MIRQANGPVQNRPGAPRRRLAWLIALGSVLAYGCQPPATADGRDEPRTTPQKHDAGVQDASLPDAGYCAGAERPLADDNPERQAPFADPGPAQPLDLSKLADLQLGLSAYILNLPPEQLAALDGSELGQFGDEGLAVAHALQLANLGMPEEVTPELRRILHAQQSCADYPATLDELRRTWGDFTEGESRTLTSSQVTEHPRIIHEASDLGLFAAQEMSDSGGVLETELVRTGGRPDGALEFLVYDQRGRRVDAAQLFVSGSESNLPVPFSCMVCHRRFGTPHFDVINPAPDVSFDSGP